VYFLLNKSDKQQMKLDLLVSRL